jgi:hypothetical protein
MSINTLTKATAAAAGIGALLLGAPAVAREAVDPSTLTPAPPASFNATCLRYGDHISCDLAFSDPDLVGEPSGIVCGSTELLVSQTRSVVGKRLYSSDGLLLQRHFREALSGTFTNPATGRSVWWAQHDTVRHDLSTPGDVGTGTTSITGVVSRVWSASGQTVLTDTGRLVVDESTGELVASSAHHPFDAYFSGSDADALAPICDAVG